MRLRTLFSLVAALMMVIPLLSSSVFAEDQPTVVPDKLLCAKMIRFGKEAYNRGRFQDAKEYFRKATMYDPNSKKAWRYYDQAVLFALAERVETKENQDLLLPGTSTRQKIQAPAQQSTTQTDQPAQQVEELPVIQSQPVAVSDDEDEEEEEEGC